VFRHWRAGVYLETSASATVITKLPGVVCPLSIDALKKMEENDSKITASLQKTLANNFSKRLVNNNSTGYPLLD
jgi:hypothetical protein